MVTQPASYFFKYGPLARHFPSLSFLYVQVPLGSEYWVANSVSLDSKEFI